MRFKFKGIDTDVKDLSDSDLANLIELLKAEPLRTNFTNFNSLFDELLEEHHKRFNGEIKNTGKPVFIKYKK